MSDLKAPFPYFGGKSKVVDQVWKRFGDTRNYVEPFCGSCAVLLGRPTVKGSESVNDINGLLINFWRSVKYAPEETAKYAESPPSTIDLKAKHNYVYDKRSELAEKMSEDPQFFDPKIAGYWIYAQSTMIGGSGIFQGEIGMRKPLINAGGSGIHANSVGPLKKVFQRLKRRLKGVHILCSDWKDALSTSCTTQDSTNPRSTAIFLDPPYQKDEYCSGNYEHANPVFGNVLEWCRKNQDNEYLRIALCGYTENGVSEQIPEWNKWVWSRQGGYANRGDKKENKHRECIWFSPSCRLTGEQKSLL